MLPSSLCMVYDTPLKLFSKNSLCFRIDCVFQWHRESSEAMYQVVPLDTSLRTCTKEIPVKHPASAVGETHTYGENGGKPSISLKSETLPATPKVAACELTSQERDSALLRYKQKKKTRRYYYYNIFCLLCVHVCERYLFPNF